MAQVVPMYSGREAHLEHVLVQSPSSGTMTPQLVQPSQIPSLFSGPSERKVCAYEDTVQKALKGSTENKAHLEHVLVHSPSSGTMTPQSVQSVPGAHDGRPKPRSSVPYDPEG